MLRAEELMVGDYLTFRDALKDNNPVTVKVVAINGATNELLASIDGDPTLDRIDIDDELCGIPLTPEILEKNGFVEEEYPIIYDRREFELRHGDYRIIVSPLNDGYTRIYKGGYLPILNNCYINFVHELQHALRLCGIDKTIEL